MSIAHVVIIIKLEVSTFPIVIIFFRGCVSEMFVASYSVTYCIYITGNREFVFIIIVQFMMSANGQIRFDLKIVFIYLYITIGLGHETVVCAVCLSVFLCTQAIESKSLCIILSFILPLINLELFVWTNWVCAVLADTLV